MVSIKQHVDVEVLLQPQCTEEDAQKATKWVLDTLSHQEHDDWYYRHPPGQPLFPAIPPSFKHIIHSIHRCDMQETVCGVLACQV